MKDVRFWSCVGARAAQKDKRKGRFLRLLELAHDLLKHRDAQEVVGVAVHLTRPHRGRNSRRLWKCVYEACSILKNWVIS